MKNLLLNLSLIGLLLSFAGSVSAHGLATSDSQPVGNYVVEFEYNSTGNVVVGEYTLFLVYLLDAETKAGVNYDSASVRIEKENGPGALTANLKGSSDGLGFSSISGTVPSPGTHKASVSFYKEGQVLASADFDFMVDPVPSASKSWVWPAAGLGVLMLGFLVGRLLKFRKD